MVKNIKDLWIIQWINDFILMVTDPILIRVTEKKYLWNWKMQPALQFFDEAPLKY